MMTADEKRLAVIEQYKTLLGRNHYSQELRNYCFEKYKDGNYYSDCSSSVSFAYEKAGYGFGNMTTMDMIISGRMIDVKAIIKDGIIQNPEILKIGDLLLFAGNDEWRKKYDYVGHVEMVANISENGITVYGHGQGFPREKELNEVCKARYETKAETPIGNRGLIRVRRVILDDDDKKEYFHLDDKTLENTKKVIGIATSLGSMNIRKGPGIDFDSISIINEGHKVEVLEFLDNGWMKIVWYNGENGIAFTSYKNGKYYDFMAFQNK